MAPTSVLSSQFSTTSLESTRPDRLTENKGREYHLKHARWTLNGLNTPIHRDFVRKTLINWSFYKNRQWIFNEDLAQFFKDESGNIRHRIKFTKNLIRPMVEQFVGNAIRLKFNARVKSTSKFAINRRERELSRLKFHTGMANEYPEFADALKDRLPIGANEQESEDIFNNLWKDEFEETMNNLLRVLESKVNIEEVKVVAARHLALSGVTLFKDYEQNLEYVGEPQDPLFWWWDIKAKKPDMTDGNFMGDWSYKDSPEIFERWQKIFPEERKAIEKHSMIISSNMHQVIREFYGTSPMAIPVFETYWRDLEKQEYGYVMDEYGYPMFTRINSPDNNFKDSDLIDAPNDEAKERMEGKKKTDRYVDRLRFAAFIPKEEIGGGADFQEDIVLDWGPVPYAPKDMLDPYSIKWPHKAYAWVYDKGEILSPIDDAIDPQRFVNRLLSVSEGLINNAGGAGVAIAKQAIDARDSEGDMKRDIKQGNPITVDISRVGSVGNAVGRYDASLPAGAQFYFNLVREMGFQIQDTSGINEAMTGTEGGQQQLVGVIESRIQRGTIIQEPFYFALSQMLLNIYESMANKGRMIYADNPRNLSINVGDKGAQEIIITKDMKLEDFTMEVKRVSSDEDQVASGNNLLFTLLQLQLLDRDRFANLLNRADADKIADSVRDYMADLKEVEREQIKQQNAQLAQNGQQLEDQARLLEQKEDSAKLGVEIEAEKDRMNKIDLVNLKETHKTLREG